MAKKKRIDPEVVARKKIEKRIRAVACGFIKEAEFLTRKSQQPPTEDEHGVAVTDDQFKEPYLTPKERKEILAAAQAKAKARDAGKTDEELEEEEERKDVEISGDDARNAEMISRVYPDDPKLAERKHLFSDVFYAIQFHQRGDSPWIIAAVIGLAYPQVRSWIRKYGNIPYRELTPFDIQDELDGL